MTKLLKGTLKIYFEQGSKGAHWAFIEEGKTGYDAVHFLEKGDLLQVFNNKMECKTLFRGEIDLGDEALRQVGSMTVHGVQKNMAPEFWAKLFLDEKPAQLKLNNNIKKGA